MIFQKLHLNFIKFANVNHIMKRQVTLKQIAKELEFLFQRYQKR